MKINSLISKFSLVGALFLSNAAFIYAQNTNVLNPEFQVGNFSITAGESVGHIGVNISLPQNTQSITYSGFQFDITLPDGITLDNISANSNLSGITLRSAKLNTGNTWRVAALNYEANTTYTVTQEVVYLNLSADKTVAATTDAKISFTDALLVAQDATDIDCSNSSSNFTIVNVPITGIEIVPGNSSAGSSSHADNQIYIDEEIEYTVKITPSNATITDLEWTLTQTDDFVSSSDITNGKKLTGLKFGEATLTAKSSIYNVTGEFKVNVVPMPIEKVTVTAGNASLEPEGTTTLTAVVTPAEKYTGPVSITWSADNSGHVSVNPTTGVVTAVSVGKAVVTATATYDNGKTATGTIEITVVPISSDKVTVKVSPSDSDASSDGSISIVAGKSKQLNSNISHDTKYTGEITTIWTSSNSSVLSVDNAGLITANKYDNQTVTVTSTVKYGNYTVTGSIKVNITQVPIESVTASAQKTEINIGESINLSAASSPATTLTGNVNYTWKTANTDLITLGSDGKVTGKAPGTATITVTAANNVSSKEGTIQIKVLATPAESIEIQTLSLERYANKDIIKLDETLNFKATIYPENAAYKDVEWSVDNPSIATLTSTTGEYDMILTAKSLGNVVVTAKVKATPTILATYNISVVKEVLGDANDNGIVNISDPLAVGNEIVVLKNNTVSKNAKFSFINADVNIDKIIDVTDQALITDMLYGLFDPYQPTTRNLNNDLIYFSDSLVADDFKVNEGNVEIGFKLDNPSDYIILQATIHLPENMRLSDIAKGPQAANHEFIYSINETNDLTIVIYAMPNTSFSNLSGNLFSIVAETSVNTGDIFAEDIIVADNSRRKYVLDFRGGHNQDTTGISSVETESFSVISCHGSLTIINAADRLVTIYSVNGQLVKSFVPASRNESVYLSPGIYIVNSDESTFKVIVK